MWWAMGGGERWLPVCRYVERNALRAGLVLRGEDWCWGSLWQRVQGQPEGRPALAAGPVPLPDGWTEWVNAPQTVLEEAALHHCARRGEPFGSAAWVGRAGAAFGGGGTQRRPGRPRGGPAPRQPPPFSANASFHLPLLTPLPV